MGRPQLTLLLILLTSLLLASTAAAQDDQARVFLRFEGSEDNVKLLSAAESRLKAPILEAGGVVFAGTTEMEAVFSECRENMGVAATTERECQLQAANRISVEQLLEVSGRSITKGSFELTLKVWEPGSNAELYAAFVEVEATSLEAAAREGFPKLALKYVEWNSPYGGGSAAISAGAVLDRGTSIVNEIVDDTGFLTIKSEPSGASIYINGEQKAVTPWRDELMVGRYVIVVENGSLYEPGRQELKLDSKGATMNFELVPHWGSLLVESEPTGAEVYLDGVLLGTTPLTDDKRPSGVFQLRVRKAGYLDADSTIEVKDGKKTEHRATLERNAGELVVRSEPKGARVLLDGSETDQQTPAIFPDLQPGTYVVTLRLAGYGEAVEKAKVERGQQATTSSTLEPMLGLVSVLSAYEDGTPCDGELFVDGVPSGTTPAKIDALAASHELRVRCPEGEAKDTIMVKHNEKARVDLVITRAGRKPLEVVNKDHPSQNEGSKGTLSTLGWVGLGLGVASAGTGVVLSLMASSDRDDLKAVQGDPVTAMGQQEAFDVQESADTLATTGAVLMGVGGVLAATGLILVLTDSGDEEAIGVSALGLPGGFALGMRGRF